MIVSLSMDGVPHSEEARTPICEDTLMCLARERCSRKISPKHQSQNAIASSGTESKHPPFAGGGSPLTMLAVARSRRPDADAPAAILIEPLLGEVRAQRPIALVVSKARIALVDACGVWRRHATDAEAAGRRRQNPERPCGRSGAPQHARRRGCWG